jgi:hypothetical protein
VNFELKISVWPNAKNTTRLSVGDFLFAIILGFTNIPRVLNRLLVCRCAKTTLMANEIAGFGDLKFYLLVILSDLTIKCVIGFDRLVRILKDQ